MPTPQPASTQSAEQQLRVPVLGSPAVEQEPNDSHRPEVLSQPRMVLGSAPGSFVPTQHSRSSVQISFCDLHESCGAQREGVPA